YDGQVEAMFSYTYCQDNAKYIDLKIIITNSTAEYIREVTDKPNAKLEAMFWPPAIVHLYLLRIIFMDRASGICTKKLHIPLWSSNLCCMLFGG
ncbi:hypothetical protein ACJX0J_010945, partial [Zea mays]